MNETTATGPEPRGRANRGLMVALAAAVVVVLALTAFLLTRPERDSGGAGSASAAGSAPTATASESPSLTPEQEAAREEAIRLLRAEPRRQENDPYARGPVDASIVLVEFADFRCPYCAKHAQETSPLLEKFVQDGTLRVEWRDLPVLGAESMPIHQAARAAGRQGMFWEFHDAVFAQSPLDGHRTWDDAQLRTLAEEIGIPDIEQWEADRADPAIAAEIEADVTHATSDLGIEATPAFILGDVFIPGAYPLSTFVQQIDAQTATPGA